MPQVLVEMDIKKTEPLQPEAQADEVKADFMTLGGGIVLAVTLVVTIFLFLSMAVSVVEGLQFAIIAILAIACWAYLINRSSEKLRLSDGALEFRAILGRTQRFSLDEITALRLTDLGWNLNGDFFVLEIGLKDQERAREIGLGPCWRRAALRSFIRSVGQTLEKISGQPSIEDINSPIPPSPESLVR